MAATYHWTKVDALDLPSNLTFEDTCLFYLRYTPRHGYQDSEANQIVLNYKIPIQKLRENPYRQRYKDEANDYYAKAIVQLISTLAVNSIPISRYKVGVLPIPPSKAPNDPDYDNRTLRTAQNVCNRTGFTLCEDIETASSIVASHSGGTRNPDTIKQTLHRTSNAANTCDWVFLVDDVLVSGAHFAAVKTLLQETGFCGGIIGLFLARSIEQ